MIFSENETGFTLEANPLKTEAEVVNGLWLVIAGINEIPPHIALISDGKYYSVSTRKVDCGTSPERFMNTIERKQVPSLFIQFRTTNVRVQNFEPLQSIYTNLKPLGPNQNTCLSPIKTFFTECYSPDFANVNFVFELLSLAETKGLIMQCFSIFSEPSNSNGITLPKYSMPDIQNKIQELSLQNRFR